MITGVPPSNVLSLHFLPCSPLHLFQKSHLDEVYPCVGFDFVNMFVRGMIMLPWMLNFTSVVALFGPTTRKIRKDR